MPDINSDVWLQHDWHNRIQTLLLLLVIEGFLALLGWLIWGPLGILLLVMVGVMGTLLNQTISPWMVIRMYHAQPISLQQAPALWYLISRLSERAALSRVPELYYVPTRMLNAFAVGSEQASIIAVSDGLLRQMTARELAGVMAHEISHIKHNDLNVMCLADLFSRVTNILSMVGLLLLLLNLPLILLSEQQINWFVIVLLITAPSVSALAQLALSRTREFAADLNAARLTGDPVGLASALNKIEQVQGGWLERIFMPGRRIPEPSLLRTHPDNAERIARLMALKSEVTRAHTPILENMPHQYSPITGKPVTRNPGWHINGLWH